MRDIDRQNVVQSLRSCLTARPEILDAYLFGSSARGDATRHSDIDVAVFVEPDRLPDSELGYLAELTAELGTALGSDAVDVVVLNHAPPLVYHRVLRDGVRVLARNLTATTTREGRALSRFCDYVPHLRKIDVAHTARIEAGSFGR